MRGPERIEWRRLGGELDTNLEASLAGMDRQLRLAVMSCVQGANADWRDDNDINARLEQGVGVNGYQRTIHLPAVAAEYPPATIVYDATLLGSSAELGSAVGQPSVLQKQCTPGIMSDDALVGLNRRGGVFPRRQSPLAHQHRTPRLWPRWWTTASSVHPLRRQSPASCAQTPPITQDRSRTP